MGGKPVEPARVAVLRDLEQVRVLADPLRVRILEALCAEERTTKQVAETLGEKPTKLYHHVEALERVGLVRQTRTRRNRGTLEKYYRAVALRFEADSRLFREPARRKGGDEPLGDMIAQLLARTGEELRRLAGSESAATIEEKGILTFCEIRGEEREVERIRRRLERLVKDIGKLEGTGGGEPRRYRLTLAYYPLDRS